MNTILHFLPRARSIGPRARGLLWSGCLTVLAMTPVIASAQNVGINGVGGCPFATIDDALGAASSGDTLYVSPGTYSEPELFLTSTFITIQGSNAGCNAATVGQVTIEPDASSHRTFTLDDAGLGLVGVRANGGQGMIGAVVYLEGDSSLATVDSEIRNASSDSDGGCIYAVQSVVLLGRGTDVRNCIATDDGGAVALVLSTMFALAGSDIFFNDAANGDGGGVYVAGSNATFSGDIRDNTAGGNGGGVAVVDSNGIDGSAGIQDDGTIHDNTADGNGGGVYVTGVDESFAAYDDAEIHTNTAVDGGGVYASFSAELLLNEDVSVHHNTASDDGGGVFGYWTENLVWDGLDGLSIAHNVAASEGGGVYLERATLEATDIAIRHNEAGTIGGGLRVVGDPAAAPVCVADLENALIANNTAQNGGGVHVSGATFTLGSNYASCAPGALANGVFCSEIRDNDALAAAGNGGGVRALSGAVVEIEETAFEDNSSIAASGTTTSVTLRNDLVEGHVGSAAVQSTNSSLTIAASTFADNDTPIVYGAAATGSVSRSIIWDNTNDSTLNASITGDCNITQTVAGEPVGASNDQDDPLFAGAAGVRSAYELTGGSPAIDACGAGPAHDIDGDPRNVGATGYDRGAFEF
jgi:hypothetical protein